MKAYRCLFSFAALSLTACFGSMPANSMSKGGVSVSLHGVNYTDRPFQYVVVDPADENNSGGGEHISPFSAGGMVCCYTLPKKWFPGMAVVVRSTHWLPKDANGEMREIRKDYIVEMPAYPGGEAGELWVLRTREGKIEVVSSNYQPNHPNWPGKVKGWPVPSREYRRDRWDIHRKLAEASVENSRELIRQLKDMPEKAAQSAWNHHKEYGDRNELKDSRVLQTRLSGHT